MSQLYPLQHTELPPVACIQAFHVGMLLLNLLQAEAAGVAGASRMISHPEIAVAPPTRRLGHLLQGVAAVGKDRVAMQEAFDIAVRHEWDRAFPGTLQLASSFPQLGRDERQSECAVDLLLHLAGDEAAVPVQP